MDGGRRLSEWLAWHNLSSERVYPRQRTSGRKASVSNYTPLVKTMGPRCALLGGSVLELNASQGETMTTSAATGAYKPSPVARGEMMPALWAVLASSKVFVQLTGALPRPIRPAAKGTKRNFGSGTVWCAYIN